MTYTPGKGSDCTSKFIKCHTPSKGDVPAALTFLFLAPNLGILCILLPPLGTLLPRIPEAGFPDQLSRCLS